MWNDGIYFIAEIQWKTASSQNFTEIGQSAAELWPQPIFNMAAVRHLEFEKKIIFGHLPVIEFQICICVPNFINIGWFFVQIWRFYDLQYGGHPPSWIFEILRFSHLTSIAMLFCFPVQNFTEAGQSAAELWQKNNF